MKTQFFRFLALSFALVIFSAAAFAQSRVTSIEIPFNFHVSNEKFAAGKYIIQRISDTAFLIQNTDEKASILAQMPLTLENRKASAAEKIVFNRYGDEYFLRQIFTNRNGVGRALYESKSEKMARKGWQNNEETAGKSKPTQVAVQMKTN